MIKTSWTQVKNAVILNGITLQWVQDDNSYTIVTINGNYELQCTIPITDPAGSDQLDFETNYKIIPTVKLSQVDTDGAGLARIKAAPTGWTYQQRGFDFQTSTLDSIMNFDFNKAPLGDATIHLYDIDNVLITDPEVATTDCVKTVVDLVPPYDLYVIAGDAVCLVPPSDDAFISVVIAPDYPAPIGSKAVISSVNLKYVATGDRISADGRAGKGLLYNNPAPGSNKIRFIIYHTAGEVLSVGVQLETYRL